MRDRAVDGPAIPAEHLAHRHVTIEDLHLKAPPDEVFDERDHRALAKIVGLRFEAEPTTPMRRHPLRTIASLAR